MPIQGLVKATIGAVGVDDTAPGQGVQQMLGGPAVRGLPRRQQEGEGSAWTVGDGMDLGVATAPADTDRLEVRPPFPPAAERWAFTCVLSISTSDIGRTKPDLRNGASGRAFVP